MTGHTPRDHRGLLKAIAEDQDKIAFRQLYEHFAPRLKGYFLRSGCPAEAAEDLVQESMEKVWRRSGSYDFARAEVSTWVFTIARNCFVDRVRRQRRPQPDREDPTWTPDSPGSPEQQASAVQSGARLHAAVAELPEEQRAVIRANFMEGKSLVRIAAETDKPLGTIKTRARLALKRLRSALALEEVS